MTPRLKNEQVGMSGGAGDEGVRRDETAVRVAAAHQVAAVGRDQD